MTTRSQLNEIHLQVLRAVESRPKLTQRDIAKELGVSLGNAHYCMKKLVQRSLVKMGSFSYNQKRREYVYFLIPGSIKTKAALAAHVLVRKVWSTPSLNVIQKTLVEDYKQHH